MNNNYQNYNDDELEIDLVDVIYDLMRHWRSLIFSIVFGALLGIGIYLCMPKETDAEAIIVKTEKYKPEEAELNSMELASGYRRLYEIQLTYAKESLLMQMDPDNIYVGKLRYQISGGSNTEYISLLYQDITNSAELLESLKEVAGLECDNKYIKEIISCAVNRGEDSYVGEGLEPFLKNGNYITQNVVLDYNITYDDKDTCAKMLDILREEVEKFNEECEENYSDYSLKEIGNNVIQSIRSDILASQKACADAIGVYLTAIEKYEGTFSEDAQAYYEVEYLGKLAEEGKPEEVSEEVPAAPKATPKDMAKWVLLGVLLLCVCWGGIWVLRYILDKRVKNIASLEDNHHLSVIGRISSSASAKKGIDGWIEKKWKKHLALSDDIEYVVCAVLSLGKSSIVFCGNSDNLFGEQLEEVLQCNHLNVYRDGFIYQNKNALAKAKNSDGVILVIALNKTTHRDIQRELAVCRMQDIPVLGAIVTE